MSDFVNENGYYVYKHNKSLRVSKDLQIVVDGVVVGQAQTLSIAFDLLRTINFWM